MLLPRYGWIYLVKENGDDLLHKIGVTKCEDPQKRLKKLQTGNGNQLIMIDCFLSSKPFKLEKMLHDYYKMNRQEGEWFLLSKDDVSKFKGKCEDYEKIINLMQDNPFF